MQQRNLLDLSFWGPPRKPDRVTFPGMLAMLLVVFELLAVVTIVIFFTDLSRERAIVHRTVGELRTRDCFIRLTPCNADETSPHKFPFGVTTSTADIADSNMTQLFVTPSLTHACDVSICVVADRNETLTVYAEDSVVEVDFRGAPFSVPPLEIKSTTTAKVNLAPGTYSDVIVNITSGVASATDVVTPFALMLVGHGSAVISSSFDPALTVPFTVTGSVRNEMYCVAPELTTTNFQTCVNASEPDAAASEVVTALANSTSAVAAAISIALEGLDLVCPVYASYTNGSTSVAASNFEVHASSLYINKRYNGTNGLIDFEEALNSPSGDGRGGPLDAPQPRIAGEGMAEFPIIPPSIVRSLTSTQQWHALSTFDTFVQAVDVVTPGLGTKFLHSSKGILLDIGVEWVTFFTAGALVPQYRRFTAPLSHYRCPTVQPADLSLAGAQTLMAMYDTTPRDASVTEALVLNHFNVYDQQFIASAVVFLADDGRGAIAISSPSSEYHDEPGVASLWSVDELRTGDNGTVSLERRQQSPLSIALLSFSVTTSLMIVVLMILAAVNFRRDLVSYFMLLRERDLYRNAGNYTDLCPYHCFFASIFWASWVVFRMMIAITDRVRGPMMRAFLKLYFISNDEVSDDGDRSNAALKAVKSTSLARLIERFENWALLRYTANTHSREEIEGFIDEFGGRRVSHQRMFVQGLARKPVINPGSIFALDYTSLQNFFEVTRNPRDDVDVDEILQRALIDDPSISREQLVTKLRGWRLPMVTRQVPVILDIRPKAFTKECLLTAGELQRVVAELEFNASSIPSYGYVMSLTLGDESKTKRMVIRRLMSLVEVSLTACIMVLPYFVSLFLAAFLEIEHHKYSTSASTIKFPQIRESVTRLGSPVPRNPLFLAATYILITSMLLAMLEPILVVATYRIAATYKSNKRRVRDVLLLIRAFVTVLALIMLAVTVTMLLWYVGTVLIWWVLGAIISPRRMLVFAAAVFGIIFLVYSTLTSLDTLRKLTMKRLEERILEEMIKLIRASPAGNVFDAVNSKASGGGSGGGFAASGSNVQITAGLLLDVVSDNAELRAGAIEKLGVALDVPPVILDVGLALTQPRPATIRSALGGAIEAMNLPPVLEPVLAQLAFKFMGFPTRVRELVHALYDLVPEYRTKLEEHDSTLVALGQAALSESVSVSTLTHAIVNVCTSQLSAATGVPALIMQNMYEICRSAAAGEQSRCLTELHGLLTHFKGLFDSANPMFRAAFRVAQEAILMASNAAEHNLREAIVGLIECTGLGTTPIALLLRPMLTGKPSSFINTSSSTEQPSIATLPPGAQLKVLMKRAEAAGVTQSSVFSPNSGDNGANPLVGVLPSGNDGGNDTGAPSDAAPFLEDAGGKVDEACSGMDPLVVQAGTLAAQLTSVVESGATLALGQRDLLAQLTAVATGDIDDMDALPDVFLPVARHHSTVLLEALDVFDSFMDAWRAQATIRKYATGLSFMSVRDAALLSDEVYRRAAATPGDFEEHIQPQLKRMRAFARRRSELAAQQTVENAPLVLQMWLVDQWAMLGSLFALRFSTPPALCNYGVLEQITGVPAEALRTIRKTCQVILGTMTSAFDIDFEQLHVDLLAAVDAATRAGDAIEDMDLLRDNTDLQLVLLSVNDLARGLLRPMFPRADDDGSGAPAGTLPSGDDARRTTAARVAEFVLHFSERLRAKIDRQVRGQLVDPMQLLKKAGKAPTKMIGSNPLGMMAKQLGGASTVPVPTPVAQGAHRAAAAVGEDSRRAAREAGKKSFFSSLTTEDSDSDADSDEDEEATFREDLSDACLGIFSDLASRGATSQAQVDYQDVVAATERMIGLLSKSGRIPRQIQLMLSSKEKQATLLENVAEAYVTTTVKSIPVSGEIPRSLDAIETNLDVSTIANLLDIARPAVEAVLSPGTFCRSVTGAEGMSMILRALQGYPSKSILTQSNLKRFLRPWLHGLGIKDVDYPAVEDAVSFFCTSGSGRSALAGSEKASTSALGRIFAAAQEESAARLQSKAVDAMHANATAAANSDAAKKGPTLTLELLRKLKDTYLAASELRRTARDASLIRSALYMSRIGAARRHAAEIADGLEKRRREERNEDSSDSDAEDEEITISTDLSLQVIADTERGAREQFVPRREELDVHRKFGYVAEEVIEACYHASSLVRLWKYVFRRMRSYGESGMGEARKFAETVTPKVMMVMKVVMPHLHQRVIKATSAFHSWEQISDKDLRSVIRKRLGPFAELTATHGYDKRLTHELHFMKMLLNPVRNHDVVRSYDPGVIRNVRQAEPELYEISIPNGDMASDAWQRFYGDVDNGDVDTDLQQAFANMTPFALLHEGVPEAARQLFAILHGVSGWLPSDLPPSVYSFVTALIRGPETPREVLATLVAPFPLKRRGVLLDLANLACGRSNTTVYSLAAHLNVPVARLASVLNILIPYEHVPQDPKQMVKRIAGTDEVKVRVPRPNWFAVLRSVATNDVMSLIKYGHFLDDDIAAFALVAIPPGRAKLQRLVVAMFPKNAVVTTLNKALEDAQTEAADQLGVSAKDVASAAATVGGGGDAIRAAASGDPAKADRVFGNLISAVCRLKPEFEKPLRLLAGVFHMAVSNFDHALTHWEAFAGNDVVQLAAVRGVALASRLILEDGAVADADGALKAASSLMLALPKLQPALYAAVLKRVSDLCKQAATAAKSAVGDAVSPSPNTVQRPGHNDSESDRSLPAFDTATVKMGLTQIDVPVLDSQAIEVLDAFIERLVSGDEGSEDPMAQSTSLEGVSVDVQGREAEVAGMSTRLVESMLVAIPFIAEKMTLLLDDPTRSTALPEGVAKSLRGFMFLLPDEVLSAMRGARATEAMAKASAAVAAPGEFDFPAGKKPGDAPDESDSEEEGTLDAIRDAGRRAASAAGAGGADGSGDTGKQGAAIVSGVQDKVASGALEQADHELENALRSTHGDTLGSSSASEQQLAHFGRVARFLLGSLAEVGSLVSAGGDSDTGGGGSKSGKLMSIDTSKRENVLNEMLDVVDAAIQGVGVLFQTPTLSSVLDVLLKLIAEAEEAHTAFEASVSGGNAHAALAAAADEGGFADKLALFDGLKRILATTQPGPSVFLAILGALAEVAEAGGGGGGGDGSKGGSPAPAIPDNVPNVKVTVKVEGISSKDLEVLRLLLGLVNGDEEALPGLLQLTGVEVSPELTRKFTSTMRIVGNLRNSAGSPAAAAEAAASNAGDLIRQVAQSIFDELDTDRSGLLSFDEFKTALARLRIQIPEHEARMAFVELDVDKSGKLSIDEFQIAIKNIRQRYLDRMLDHLHMSREAVYVTTIWTVLFIVFFTTFLLLGFIGFTDGEAFTAATTALMPLLASVGGLGKDGAAQMAKLYNKIDDLVAGFFEVLARTSVTMDVEAE